MCTSPPKKNIFEGGRRSRRGGEDGRPQGGRVPVAVHDPPGRRVHQVPAEHQPAHAGVHPAAQGRVRSGGAGGQGAGVLRTPGGDERRGGPRPSAGECVRVFVHRPRQPKENVSVSAVENTKCF